MGGSMEYDKEQEVIAAIKKYISDNLILSQLSDEQLEKQIEAMIK